MTVSVTYTYLKKHFSDEYWTESASSDGLISRWDVNVDSSGSWQGFRCFIDLVSIDSCIYSLA